MSTIRAMLLGAALIATPNVYASATSDATATCLVDSTTGKDRKLLARWIFLAMAQHPAITQLSKATPADNEDAHKEMGALFTRLVADDCPDEFKAMLAADGAGAIESAFELLGKMAMQELMADPKVAESIGGLNKYVDEAKVGAVLAPGG
ncbi:MAG TPA: hypothetical protein VFL14_15265 [Xanthomonadales bacterium]|nr:hypothetical protein [Xanthomonadales bacterium]